MYKIMNCALINQDCCRIPALSLHVVETETVIDETACHDQHSSLHAHWALHRSLYLSLSSFHLPLNSVPFLVSHHGQIALACARHRIPMPLQDRRAQIVHVVMRRSRHDHTSQHSCRSHSARTTAQPWLVQTLPRIRASPPVAARQMQSRATASRTSRKGKLQWMKEPHPRRQPS